MDTGELTLTATAEVQGGGSKADTFNLYDLEDGLVASGIAVAQGNSMFGELEGSTVPDPPLGYSAVFEGKQGVVTTGTIVPEPSVLAFLLVASIATWILKNR